MPRKNRPDWSAKLSRSLTLEDGTKLVTLADARGALLIRYFERGIESAAVTLAIEWLLTAAETGSFTDRETATDQIEIMLKWPQRVEPFGRQLPQAGPYAKLAALMSAAQYDSTGWAALAGRSNGGAGIGSASDAPPCDELSEFDRCHLLACLAAELQEEVAAQRDADGLRRHRWPAFLLAQAQPDPSPLQTERLKGFAEVAQGADALNSNRDPVRDLGRVLEQDEDAFSWAAPRGQAV
jgi:hypothetical protein